MTRPTGSRHRQTPKRTSAKIKDRPNVAWRVVECRNRGTHDGLSGVLFDACMSQLDLGSMRHELTPDTRHGQEHDERSHRRIHTIFHELVNSGYRVLQAWCEAVTCTWILGSQAFNRPIFDQRFEFAVDVRCGPGCVGCNEARWPRTTRHGTVTWHLYRHSPHNIIDL